MMGARIWIIAGMALILVLGVSACDSPNPQPPGLTPIPALAPGATPTLVPALQFSVEPTATAAPGATAAPVSTAEPDAALGAFIFLQNCSACHRVNAEGGINAQGEDVPALRNNQFVLATNPRVFSLIANGRPGTMMPGWLQANGGPLDEQEIRHVIAYLQTLQNAPPLPTGAPLPTTTPAPRTTPVRPSEPGGPGAAASLTGDAGRGRALFGKYCATCHGPQGIQGLPNPGSNSGFVPALTPIHPTIANADTKVFAANLDVFIEHGSAPSGRNPLLRMPAFGDGKMLTSQQIADLIAYIMSLNKP